MFFYQYIKNLLFLFVAIKSNQRNIPKKMKGAMKNGRKTC